MPLLEVSDSPELSAAGKGGWGNLGAVFDSGSDLQSAENPLRECLYILTDLVDPACLGKRAPASDKDGSIRMRKPGDLGCLGRRADVTLPKF